MIAKKPKATKSYIQKAYLDRFPYNLVNSGNLAEYFQTLTDFKFLAKKINHPELGVQALIADYDLVDDPPQPPLKRGENQPPQPFLERGENISLTPEKVKTLKRVQGALRLSAHVLAKDKTQLAGQLLGRLLPLPPVTSRQAQAQQKQADYRYFWEYIPWIGNFLPKYSQNDLTVEADPTATAPDINQSPIIQGLLEQAKQWKQSPWLRPLSASLTPPGGRLLGTLSGHSDRVNAVAVTGDGTRAISGSRDNTLKVWNLETGAELLTLNGHSDRVNAVAVTGDGTRAISGSLDNTLKVWNLETGEQLLTLNGHSELVFAVAVTGDGTRAISGSGDNTLKVWNLETGAQLLTLNGHSFPVYAVAVTGDSTRAISGSFDNTLKVWNLETGEVIASFTGESPINCCAVAPDGVTIVAGEASGQVHFLLIENSNL